MLRLILCGAFLGISCIGIGRPSLRADDLIEKYRAAAVEKWAKDMERIAARDRQETDPKDAILFLGSSSIRLWKEIASDLKSWPVIERGYGGAKFSDLAVLADQIIKPHQFRALVIFVGNDIVGGKDDKSPAEVAALFKHVVATARRHAPKAPIFLIEITPTPKRWEAWPKIQQSNAALKAACEEGDNLHFISTAKDYLTPDGKPMPELFKEDQLHQNRDGYARWSRIIDEALRKTLK